MSIPTKKDVDAFLAEGRAEREAALSALITTTARKGGNSIGLDQEVKINAQDYLILAVLVEEFGHALKSAGYKITNGCLVFP